MRNIFITFVAGLTLLTGCVKIPDAKVVSATPAAISLSSDLVLNMGDNVLQRDRKMAEKAQEHCSKYGKNAVQTIFNKDANFINMTFYCE